MIDAVWRIESARIIAGLVRLVRGCRARGGTSAGFPRCRAWSSGLPRASLPGAGAWLMLTAKHRAIDRIRRDERLAGKLSLLGREMEMTQHDASATFDAVLDDLDDERIDDDRAAADVHLLPSGVLSTAAVALTLTSPRRAHHRRDCARASSPRESTIAQRIMRAKRTLAEQRDPVRGAAARCPAGPAGVGARGPLPDLQRGVLGDGRGRLDAPRAVLRRHCGSAGCSPGSMPGVPEVHGLVALMEIQASRIPARLDSDGLPVPLP